MELEHEKEGGAAASSDKDNNDDTAQMWNGVVLHRLPPLVIPSTPPGYEKSIAASNKPKIVRNRGYLLVPVGRELCKIAAEAQQLLFDETGLTFHSVISEYRRGDTEIHFLL